MKRFDVKQKITSFLLKEEGKITKKSVLTAGILLGAIAVSSGIAEAHTNHASGCSTSTQGTPAGDCENVKAIINEDCDLKSGASIHTNAAHDNNLNVKNLFGRLQLGHDNCLETHENHSNHGSHSSHDSGSCCGGGIGKVC